VKFRLECALLAIAIFAPISSLYAQTSQLWEAHARRVDEITIDGILEPAWLSAEPIQLEYQVEPDEGAPPSFRTDVYVLYTTHALYIAFDCHDSHPDSIAGQIQRRDNYNNSDGIVFDLDTFHDRRTGYEFSVTAVGVQIDGVWSNETNTDNSWDGIWQSAVGRTDEGYVVEVCIPFRTIRHGGSRPDGWGFNAYRWIERRSEWISWAPVDRAGGNRVSAWGTLHGLDDIPSARHLELLPHTVGRWDASQGGAWHSVNDWENLGLDLKLVPASSWTLDLTFQPDFAQVDVDNEVINLSDYPIYLEEKRPFFLEGLGLFNETPIELLYTRKIANPDYGGRITGQWGTTRSSLLAARNLTSGEVIQAAFAGRLTRNLGKAGSIGFTGTSLSDDYFHAHAGALDSRIRWGRENEISLFAAAVDRWEGERIETGSAADGTDSSYVVPEESFSMQPVGLFGAISLAKGNWRGSAAASYKGRDFDVNDLGFTGYSNVISQSFWVQRAIFLPAGSWVDVVRHNLNFWWEVFPDGSHWEKGGNWNFNLRTSGNWFAGGGAGMGDGYFRYTYDPDDEDQRAEDYPYRHNFGRYRVDYHPWRSIWGWFDSDYRKPVGFSFNTEVGTLRDGERRSGAVSLRWIVLSNLEVNLYNEYIQVEDVANRHDGALTDYLIGRFKVQWSPTLDLSCRATLQLVQDDVRSFDDDDESSLLLNMLIAYNWTPGSWFYLVYDDSRALSREAGEAMRRWDIGDRTIRAKWTWFVTLP